MEDWTLRDNNDSSVGVNNFVDNMQLLLKLQSLDSLIPANDNDTSQSFNEFNQSASTSDFPDEDDLVDKLFRESLAMQQADIQNEANQESSSNNLLLERILNDTKDNDITTSSPSDSIILQGKQPSSPVFDDRSDETQPMRPKLLSTPSLPMIPQQHQQHPQQSPQQHQHHQQQQQQQQKQQQQQQERPGASYFNASPIQLHKPIQDNMNTSNQPMPTSTPTVMTPAAVTTTGPTASIAPTFQNSHSNRGSVPVASPMPIPLSATPTLTTVRLPLPSTYNNTPPMTMHPPNVLPPAMLFGQLTSSLPTLPKMTPVTNGSPISAPPMLSTAPILPGYIRMGTGSSTPVRKPVPPRPQLRVHITKHKEVDPSFYDDPKDPMKPDLDVYNLRRLTMITLRALGVQIGVEELPVVDIDGPMPTDSQQVLPAAAMLVITSMVLGTSGDKDVSKTLASQISNGDLVALQRLIVAGLRTKNIVIHTVLTEQPPSAAKTNTNSGQNTSLPNNIIDLSQVVYEPPHNVTRLFLRLYRFIINMLLSTPDCWPFIQPVPSSAFVYHQEIKHPMDLQTVEENVWKGKYTKFARFEKDIRLIWKNARAFHRNTGTIPKHADYLERLFNRIVVDIKKQISNQTSRKSQSSVSSQDFKFDPADTLPEESDFSYPPVEQVFSEHSTVYSISALSPLEPKGQKPIGLTDEKLLYLQLNGPFFQAVERMKADPQGNHSMVPRFYIAKNRTLLRQIRSQGVLAIFYNTKSTRIKSSKLIRIETDMILAYPASDLFDIDQINECTEDFAPKAWIHLRPLRVVNQIVFEVNEAIERDYFKRMFATSKMAIDDKTGQSVTKKLLKRVVRQILGLPELPETLDVTTPNSASLSPAVDTPTAARPTEGKQRTTKPFARMRRKTQEEEDMDADKGSDDERANGAVTPRTTINDYPQEMSNLQRFGKKEISHDVWQRLFSVCASKGILIRNIAEHGHINWHLPNSEGFFKRVYFFQDTVVQAFRQMTMYQRITEVACLMKLRNLPHMAQVREVLYNDNGDVAGLSMERYHTTLKQYTHVHSHHRLSAYQKYDVIYQMLVCMKTIHEAGLAHRDLSEVNIMVNPVDGQYLEDGSEKVCLYLIDFGKAVFCQPQDVRDWFVDVPRAEWEYDGDVVPETKEELDTWCETLPWVKGKPDHGYRMYRSIQTLPKTRSDNQVLPWLIHPQAEDMYSIGVMMWKVFTDTEPWRGILDTDLQGLRYVAQDDYRIQRALEGEVHGELSRQLLLKCLKTRPQDRETAKGILDWIGQEPIKEGLIGEWKMYSSDTRSSRRAKTFYGFDEEDEEEKRRPRKKMNTSSKRGRPKAQKEAYLN